MTVFRGVHVTNGLPTVLSPTNSNYLKISNCKADGKIYNVNQTRNILSGPCVFDHGGDIKVQETYVITYQWGGKKQMDGSIIYNDEEIYWYVPNFGLARWTHSVLDKVSGQYVLGVNNGKPEISNHNKILSGGAPAPNFPCG